MSKQKIEDAQEMASNWKPLSKQFALTNHKLNKTPLRRYSYNMKTPLLLSLTFLFLFNGYVYAEESYLFYFYNLNKTFLKT
jgi:hypothetical protein